MNDENENNILYGPPPVEPILNISFGELIFNKLINNPNEHEALVDAITGETSSYKNILQKSSSLANFLFKNGYGKNNIIGICSENNLDIPNIIIAALFIGAITAPISHNYTQLELEHTLNISKPKLIFCSKITYSRIFEMKKKLNFIEEIIVMGDENNNQNLENCISRFLVDKFQPIEVDPNEQIAFIMPSSGTTGLPKGVMLTHLNMTTLYLTFIHPNVEVLTSNNTILGTTLLSHSSGLFWNLLSIIHNEKFIIMKQFEEKLFLNSIEKYKVTKLLLTPPYMILLAKIPLTSKYNLSSVVEIVCGNAAIHKNIQQLVKERLQINYIRQGYGLSETTLSVTICKKGEENFGSIGKVRPYMSCKIRDLETGKSLRPNEIGELCFKGPLIFKGYYNNEEAIKNSFTEDGWFLTGDLGYYDEDKYFYIVDRLKELIKCEGCQVAPAELETILLSHPEIIDAGVVGLPDETAGELPVAFVVRAPNSKIDETEVKKIIAERVSSRKHLKGGVYFVEHIPKNSSGKILRRELKNLLRKEIPI